MNRSSVLNQSVNQDIGVKNKNQKFKNINMIESILEEVQEYPVPFYAQTNIYAKHIIDVILQKGAEIIAEKYLKKKLPGFNASHCIWISEQLANFKNYPQDNQQPWNQWTEDKEPNFQKLENRQIGRVKVVKQPHSKSQQESKYNDMFEAQIEVLLAQPKLFFKVPQTYKDMLLKNKSSRSLDKYEKYQQQDKQQQMNNNIIQYKIQQKQINGSQAGSPKGSPRHKETSYIYKAPLMPRQMSPNSLRQIQNKTEIEIDSENKYQVLSNLMVNKERSFVRKIIKRETTIRNINQALIDYKENGDVQTANNEDVIKYKTNQKYLNQVKAYQFKNIQPLNLNKKIQSPKQVKLIEIPKHPVQIEYKAECRSLSPVYKKHQKLFDLNQELFLKKDQDNFIEKVKQITQKKHIHLNCEIDREKPQKRPQSPRQLKEIQDNRVFRNQEQRHERIYDLINNQKLNINTLPELNLNKYQYPQKLQQI